jgi:hypothetical protein
VEWRWVFIEGCTQFKMDIEDKEEADEDEIVEPVEIIKVDKEYELKNGLFGLMRDIILKLSAPMNREDDLKKFFGMCDETRTIKNTWLFKFLRYFPPILQLKNVPPQPDDNEYEIVGNRIFI